jgi:polyisoprenyl-phosphate glycosyltransferase
MEELLGKLYLTMKSKQNLEKYAKKLSLVIPVYFNEESLPLLFQKILDLENTLEKKKIIIELIFVDDGSEDQSLQELFKIKEKKPNVKIIKHTRNFGAIIATKTGRKFATGDCCIVIAADLQDPIELIVQMIEFWLEGNKYVIAARKTRKDPIFTKLFAYIYYILLKIFVTKDYPKGGFDLALIDKSLLPYFQNSGKNINPSLLGHWLGFKPKIIKYDRMKRDFGKSRWTFKKRLNLFLDSILGFSVSPIRIILTFGLFVSFISFIYFLWIIINAYLGNIEVKGFATIVALISFLFGIVISMLGVIGEYIWRIFDELNKKPESVVDEVF